LLGRIKDGANDRMSGKTSSLVITGLGPVIPIV